MVDYITRINDKLEQLNLWKNQLNSILPNSADSYKSDFVISAACERLTERIIEEMIIISNIILKEKGIIDRTKSFEKLNDLGILSESLFKKLEEIKGMRNLMIHNYDDFDQEIFYNSLFELIDDSNQYKKEIKSALIEN